MIGCCEVPDNVRSTLLIFLEYHHFTQKNSEIITENCWILLLLTLTFLGSIPKNGISFRMPGAASHDRWLSKAIYAFKIHMLFQDQFE